ncbi:MAG TPA: hypothetical protein VLJ39_13730 [Tepidisphaeraceae bacterium]|nr:hypothetical protein [Tepidisphaeraceae bacterium]
MAKAKKQSDATTPAADSSASSKPAAKKAAAPKKAAKTAGPPTSAPLIDTSLAAGIAAKLVANRDRLNTADPAEKRESGSFKQMKENLTKPASHGPASFLNTTAPQKKSNLPFGGRKQVGHNQTFGADVNRTGVPRRTGG